MIFWDGIRLWMAIGQERPIAAVNDVVVRVEGKGRITCQVCKPLLRCRMSMDVIKPLSWDKAEGNLRP